MKRTMILAVFVAAFSLCRGADLLISDGGGSAYQIVVQDPGDSAGLDEFVFLGGKLLQHTIFRATGAKLPLVRESERIPGKPAIFIGNTRALAEQGLSSRDFTRWEHAVTVRGKNIFLYGKDLPNPLKNVKFPRWFVYYTVGSLKAVCVFAEKFTNTRFVGIVHNTYGLHDGVRTMPLKQIKVPADFSYRNKPRFLFNNASPLGGMLYSVANNHYFNCSEDYRVHYHNLAIPQAKYAGTHPEYFALVNGKRYIHRGDFDGVRPQYCLTNPDVQRLIYENALKRADDGYTVIEFGQSDGFIGCECEKCKAWYGTDSWSEKLWCFHRDLALKLEKDRPGVTPAISCYGPTHKSLPVSFKKFPTKRMIIDLAPVTPRCLAGLGKFNVDGIVAWTYYFGSYLQCGFSPARSFRELQEELQALAGTRVYALYNCGYGNTPAINGPWLYAYGKLCGDRDLDTGELLREYCLFAFGEKAAPDFVRFFELIDARMDRFRPPATQDFNDFVRKPQIFALDFWNLRYPPRVMDQLEKVFNQAIGKCDAANFMARELRVDFEYMRLTARAAHAAAAVQKDPARANLLKLADALEKRNDFIGKLPRSKSNPRRIAEYLGTPYEKNLKAGGSMFGVFGSLFDISPALLRAENRNIEAVKVRDFDDPAWNAVPSLPLRGLKSRYPAADVSFRIGYNDEAILLKCRAPHPGPAAAAAPRDSTLLWRDPVWEIFLSNAGLNIRQMVFSSAPGSAFDATHYGKKSWVPWTGDWSHRDTVRDGVWNSCVTIPFKTIFGRVPRPGERLLMQFGFSPAGARSHYAFNVPFSGAFKDISGFAKVRFGKRPGAGTLREVDVNGEFRRKGEDGFPAGWFISPRKKDSAAVFRGGAVEVANRSGGYIGLYSRARVPLDQDENCEFTVTLRGRGEASVGAGWFRGDGDFAVNAGNGKIMLTETPRTVTWRCNCGILGAEKKVWAFQPVIFLNTAGKLIVDKVGIKVSVR